MLKKGNRANTLHGILLIVLFSFAAFYIAGFPLVKKLSFSPLIVGIVLGMLYANSLRNKLPETWVPGIRFCTKQVLRWGIVLKGFRLPLSAVAAVATPAAAVDLRAVTATILGGILLGRLLKIDRDTALMTSTGSAICGAAAVLGAEPVVKCEGYKTAIAVSTVVIFGTLSMFLYPLMYRTGMLDGLTDTGVAVYTGSTLHEVAHVAGAGNAMDPTDTLGIAGTATITKMIRVMMLAPVLVILGFVLARRRKTAGGRNEKNKITIPWFAFGFIRVICLNSLLQYLTGAESVRDIPLNSAIESVDTFMLTMAMTALGTETSIDKFKHAGAKPFVLAGLLYVWLVQRYPAAEKRKAMAWQGIATLLCVLSTWGMLRIFRVQAGERGQAALQAGQMMRRPLLGLAVQMFWCGQALAAKGLVQESTNVYAQLI